MTERFNNGALGAATGRPTRSGDLRCRIPVGRGLAPAVFAGREGCPAPTTGIEFYKCRERSCVKPEQSPSHFPQAENDSPLAKGAFERRDEGIVPYGYGVNVQ